MSTLRRVVHRPAGLPAPGWLVRLGAMLLRTDPALALTSRRCIPGRLSEQGYTFAFPRLEPALADLVGS